MYCIPWIKARRVRQEKDKLSRYNKMRPKIKTADSLVWQTNTVIGKMMQCWGRSPYTHVSMIVRFLEYDVERVYVFEEHKHGAVLLPLSNRILAHNGHAWVFPLNPDLDTIRKSMAAWALSKQGTKFDYKGLFENIGYRISEHTRKMICSAYYWLAFEEGAGIKRDKSGVKYTAPTNLAQSIHRRVDEKIGKDRVPRPSDWPILQACELFIEQYKIL